MTLADFPHSEFEARLAAAQQAMHGQGLDALLFTTEAEMRYFTGFRTLFWQSPTRPWFLVLPKQGKPVAIIPEIGAALMRETWLDDIRTWASPHADDDGVSLLVDCLAGTTKIGVMMGRESYLRMPLADYQKLADRLPGAEIVNASDLVQALRRVKSNAEIEKTTAICQIASRSFANAENLFFAGQPLNEAFRAFKIDLLQQGAEDVPYLVGGAGQGGYADVISPPSAEPLKEGDVLMLDTGATLAGYFCDFDRNYAFGHADEAAKSAYRTLYQATEAALAVARPGAKCSDLYAAMAGVIQQEGSDVGRYGHGLGMQLTEAPSIISFDETVMQPGMVMTLEPGLSIGNGKIMVHEENILICDGPPQLLSERCAPDLPVFAGG
jgi:Xaa-Pro dipeptidase